MGAVGQGQLLVGVEAARRGRDGMRRFLGNACPPTYEHRIIMSDPNLSSFIWSVPDYFDELLEHIRDIRASERRVYLRVRDILALAADYAPGDAETRAAFQIVQNKLHFAATGQTAAELIASRADASQANIMAINVFAVESDCQTTSA